MCVVLFSISHFSDACSLDYIVILFSCPRIILSCCFRARVGRSRGMQPTFKRTLLPSPMPSWAPQGPVMKVRVKRKWYIKILI